MNILNKTGQKLTHLKNEIHQDYPDIIKESMILMLDEMLRTKQIGNDAYKLVMDNKKDEDVFNAFLLSHEEYRKSPEEIREELEQYHEDTRNFLERKDIDTDCIEFSFSEEEFGLNLTRVFSLDEHFFMDYFGVTEKEMPKLMKKSGFIEAFVSLRLTKILSDMEKHFNQYPGMIVKVHYSLPYRNKEKAGFNIELFMDYSAEMYEKLEQREVILANISYILDECTSFFNWKMTV